MGRGARKWRVDAMQIHSYFLPPPPNTPLVSTRKPNLTGQINVPRKQATSAQWRLRIQGKKEIGAMRK